MARSGKPRSEKKREPAVIKVLPMELRVGDHNTDRRGEKAIMRPRPGTAWERTPWRAPQRAAWETLTSDWVALQPSTQTPALLIAKADDEEYGRYWESRTTRSSIRPDRRVIWQQKRSA